MLRKMKRGFTLAELLIALAILGVIATFAIPKVLQAQQSAQSKAIVKEAAAAVQNAYMLYQRDIGVVPSTARFGDLKPYLNTIKNPNNTVHIDGDGDATCSVNFLCVQLASGAVIGYGNGIQFGGTATTNAIYFKVDPDARYTGTDAGTEVTIFLYYNGRLTSGEGVDPNTMVNINGTPTNISGGTVPTWWNWN